MTDMEAFNQIQTTILKRQVNNKFETCKVIEIHKALQVIKQQLTLEGINNANK